jgi:endonuclease III
MAASSNRATKIGQLHQALKKLFKPLPHAERPLLELLLYACLLEDSPYEAADEAMARLEQDFFDWNEVRVTTVSELAGVLRGLPNPAAAATRLKRNLHSLFEVYYNFDLEDLKKLNLGKAVEALEKLPAMTPFVLGYVVQHALSGHMVPVDTASTQFLIACDVISEQEVQKGKSLGLDRAIAKAKGAEFSCLLHQAAVAMLQKPKDKELLAIVYAMNPAAKTAAEKAAKEVKPIAKPAADSKNKEVKDAKETKAPKATKKTPPAPVVAPPAEVEPKKSAAEKLPVDKLPAAKKSVKKAPPAPPEPPPAKTIAKTPAKAIAKRDRAAVGHSLPELKEYGRTFALGRYQTQKGVG